MGFEFEVEWRQGREDFDFDQFCFAFLMAVGQIEDFLI